MDDFSQAQGTPAWVGGLGSALLTDLYQLTMLRAYVDHGMHEEAVFEFFVRRLPADRNFLLAAGLEQLLDFLEALCFEESELEWLQSKGLADERLSDYLRGLRFTGDVEAMPEGTLVFANEPLVRITAPMPEAQLVESRLVNLVNFQTMIASKAARSVLAAPEGLLVDFGMRRAHGSEAGLLAARAAYLAGYAGTATVLAGRLFDIPVYGTMAHSFVEAHESESTAFRSFAESNADNVVLLIDTYDTPEGARKVTELLPRLREEGIEVRAVRIDSGDLIESAREVRRILDAGGGSGIRIFLSGSLNERKLESIVASGAPADGFGVGTDLDVSGDAPWLDCAYKLQEYAGRPCRKKSTGKATWPGRKQVFRHFGDDGTITGDTVAIETETTDGTPLLVPVMRKGRRVAKAESLQRIRDRAAESLSVLPPGLRSLRESAAYPVEISAGIRELAASMDNDDGI